MTYPTQPSRLSRSLVAKFGLPLLLSLVATFTTHQTFAQTTPTLGTASSFAVLGGTTVTNTGPSVITGDLGVSPGTAITGFPPGIVAGAIHAADAVALQAQADNTSAYNVLAGEPCNTTYGVPKDLVGLTLVPGVYCFSSSAALNGTVTLDAQGDPNALFIFKIASTLITGSSSSVLLTNGAQQCRVFWQVGSSATLGTNTAFVGNILALTSISLNTGATLSGRALAQNGAVTLDDNTVTTPTCAAPPANMPPTLSKSFSAPSIVAGGTSTLTITLTNPNTTAATLSSALTDSFPSGVLVAGNASTTCGGTITAIAGGTSVSMTGGAIPAASSCTVKVDVAAAAGGSFINILPIGALVTSLGSNADSANATLTVTGGTPPPVAPTLTKAFTQPSITAGGTSTLVLTLSNSNSIADTLTAPLTDTLPTGTTVSGTPTTTCVGGTATATSGSVTLTGGVIPANGSCTVTANVTAPGAGTFLNSVAAGSLQTDNGNSGAAANATLSVAEGVPTPVPPTLGKSFTPSSITLGGSSTLVITLSNNDTIIDTLTSPLVDQLPTGMTVNGTATTTCVGGVVTATTGSSTVTLTGGAIPAAGSCTVTVAVAETAASTYNNTIAAGGLQTNNGNNGTAAAATLTVSPVATPPLVAPSLGKSFSPATITLGGASNVILTLTNSNPVVDSLTAPLTDTLPTGMHASGTASTTCGGTVSALKGSSTVTLTGGAIPANGSCTVTAGVLEDCACTYHNSVAAGALHTTTGINPFAAVATLTVNPKPAAGGLPSVSKFYYPATIKPGAATTLTITFNNPNATIAKLSAPFVDYFPSGTYVSDTLATTTCGGTLAYSKGGSSITLNSGTIPLNGSCKISVHVTAPNAGTFTNNLGIGVLKTNVGNNAYSAKAILYVSTTAGSGPSLTKSFYPSTIGNDGISTLTITLKNPSGTPAKLTAPLHDYMPAHLVVYGSANNTCGGVVTASSGSSTVTLTGGTIPAYGSCTVTVKVTAPCNYYFNNIGIGALQTSIGNNQQPAGAPLTVTATTTP